MNARMTPALLRIARWMWLACAGLAQAGEVSVAVASNFAAPMQKIATAFEQQTGHKARIAVGSTGKFYAQIKNGAPFEVLLAADDETPSRLEREGLTVRDTRFTYATGRLVLWSAQPGLVDGQGAVLQLNTWERIALADPKIAPYGAAAREVLEQLGLWERVQARMVQGENIGQTYQFVATGNAALGFVALSQVVTTEGRIARGSAWIVPAQLHKPIRQDAVLLVAGQANAAAAALIAYLKGDRARAIIGAAGYSL